MVICVEIDAKTKEKLDRLILQGGFQSYSEAVAVAINNQLLLQRQVGESKSVVIGADRDASKASKDQHTGLKRSRSDADDRSSDLHVPSMFALSTTSKLDLKPASFPNSDVNQSITVTVDRWIFGQFNRLLPAKVNCRGLVALYDGSNGVLLSKAVAQIALEAGKLGDYLKAMDERYGLNRDDALATAFPVSGSDGDKARLRYGNQFVGSLNTQGELSGLLIELKLINYQLGKDTRISLTAPGLEFAGMANPILDGSAAPQRAKFSREEVEFLLNHIRLHVQVEHSAFQTIITALSAGADTPERLDDAIAQYLPSRPEKPFTRAFLSTQRSGAIARMCELGLVQRIRDGIRVRYAPTESGRLYITES
jgi:Arc/MetJ-type ribon-helix-helix transcriptional regulator